MTLRIAGLAALALLSSACTHRFQSAPRDPIALDYSDHDYYDRPFAASPDRPALPQTEAAPVEAGGTFEREAPAARPSADGSLGFTAGTAQGRVEARVEASDTDYEEVEATPGTACYDAALKAGITRGTCTLVIERKYLLVGEKADD